MKKHILILLVIFVPCFSYAQRYSNKEKATIAAHVDSLIQIYIKKSILTDPASNTQNIKVIREYKALFAANAIIYDDINAEYSQDEPLFPYVLKHKSLFEYFDEMIEQFPSGLTINTHNVNVSYSNIEQAEVRVYIARTISGTREKGKYNLTNDDTLLISLAVQPDKTVKISGVTEISSNLKVQNDDDLDGVVNELDECIDQKGPIYLKGCPDDDGDGIPNRIDECPSIKGSASNKGCPGKSFAYSLVISASGGYSMNQNNIKAPTTGFGYNHLDLSQPGTGSKVSDNGLNAGPCLNVHVAYFFGKKKSKRNKGISLGVNYGGFASLYDVGNSKYFFVARDGGNNEYWRMVTLRNGSTEEVSYSMMNISLLFRIKTKIGEKFALEFGVGPSYISYSAKSAFNGSIDYEGIYQYDKNNGTLLTSGLSHYTYDKHDWLLVKDKINEKEFNANADTMFKWLDEANIDYDFLLNSSPKNSNQKTKTDTRSGLGLNAVVDFYYHVKPRVALKVGLGFIFSSLSNNKSGSYVAADKSNGEYNSILNSSAKSTNMSFGANVGVIVGFGLGGK